MTVQKRTRNIQVSHYLKMTSQMNLCDVTKHIWYFVNQFYHIVFCATYVLISWLFLPNWYDCNKNCTHTENQICKYVLQYSLSTSSLIRPSYSKRATIFEKVFWPKKLPKTEYFPTKRILGPDWSKCPYYCLPLLSGVQNRHFDQYRPYIPKGSCSTGSWNRL